MRSNSHLSEEKVNITSKSNKKFVEICIADNGIGIKSENESLLINQTNFNKINQRSNYNGLNLLCQNRCNIND